MHPDAGILSVTPIGVIRTPFQERSTAPRQGTAGTAGSLVLFPRSGFEHAISDLDSWTCLWVLYWFHKNEGWRPRVLPPRSETRRGVFATRSPHRPNPIGLSAVRLVRVEGLTLHVLGVDMLDGSPLLDIKPYVPYADILPDAGHGWLDEDERASAAGAASAGPVGPVADPRERFAVYWEPLAERQAAWLASRHGIDLVGPVDAILSAGPTPHPYRRIRREVGGQGFRLAFKEWRIRFTVEARRVRVVSVHTGYRPGQLVDESNRELAPHRELEALARGPAHEM